MAKGPPKLNVEFSAVTDEEGRFARLASLLGLADADHARGKCEHLWVACTRRGEVALPRWLVSQVLGERGPDALIEAELARPAGGAAGGDHARLVIAGAEKHCLWLSRSQQAIAGVASKGGKARAATAPRRAGKFVANEPAETSDPDPDPDPIPENTLRAGARAIPPSPTPGGQPGSVTPRGDHPPPGAWDPSAPGAIFRVAESTWRAISDARVALAAELGMPPQLPWPAITPASPAGQIADLMARVRGEGAGAPVACALVVQNLIDQAREERDLTFLSAKAFSPGGWDHARNYVPGSKRSRAGPRSAARDVRVGAVQPREPSAYPEGEIEIP